MPRKRKVPVVDEEKENELSQNSTIHNGPMYTIMSNVQLNETFHKKYIREMQQLYSKMDHDAFMFTFIKMIKSAMESDETNEYAYTTLLFCAKFIASYDIDDTHAVLVDSCRWLLTTISQNPHIRFRLCQFVNMILNALGVEAALDDAICDSILEYMVQRLRDINPNVRVQAILALQRLQCPDNPDDIVLRVYQFHLCSDPSPRVRQAVITSMGRNYNTIPYILDRLWDIDEKVRRHTYLHMSGYPVKAYKVSQRLQLLEQGLNDRSEMVKKVVTTIMLPQWLESYGKNYITFVSALKLDSSEAEMERFVKIAKVALREIFKRQSKDDLIKCVPVDEDGEFHKCIPLEKLTMDVTIYWQCLIEYLQSEMADELDMIIPELSTFCAYVLKFCESQKNEVDKFEKMEFQYMLLSLCEILYLYDLGDEIGRENLKKLVAMILKTNDLDEKIIEVIVKCTENLITDQNNRLQFFVEIIEEITRTSSFKNDLLINDRTLIEELLEKHPDQDLKLKLSSLKVKILDLEEQEMNFVEKKDYVQAQRITEEKNSFTEEYANLLKPLIEKHTLSESNSDSAKSLSHCIQQPNKVTPETILKSLQLAFYMVVSKNVKSLTPNVCKLYNEFIGRHIASNQIAIRDWALKCGTAYSMLYEPLAKEIYEVLYAQFFKNHNIRIWKTSITCIFELLDRYGCSSFIVEERQNKSKRGGRQLYNTLEFLDADDDSSVLSSGQAVDIIFMMSHFLDTCDDVCIISAIVNGFCRLVLHDHIKSPDILEKLLLRYFNPSTDPEINQILGVFLENLIQRKKQEYLHPCLLPTVSQVISAPYESALHEIKPETVLRFVIDATRPEFCAPSANIHNKLALSFLQEMQNNVSNKDLCKILSKEILTLQMSMQDDPQLKEDLKGIADKLIKCEFDSKTLKCIIDFKDILDGIFKPPLRHTNLDGSDDEDKSDDETVSAITTEKDFDRVSSNETNRMDTVPEDDRESEKEPEQEQQTLTESEGLTQPDPESEKTISPESQIEQQSESSSETQARTSVGAQDKSSAESQDKSSVESQDKSSVESQDKSSIESQDKSSVESEDKSPVELQNKSSVETQADPSPENQTEASQTSLHEQSSVSARSTSTPTTYGRENYIGLRYLRKSMNFTRQTSIDGEKSPKIRIEARIDSIPVVTPPKVQKMNETGRATRRTAREAAPRTPVQAKNAAEQTNSTQRQSARKKRKVAEEPVTKTRAQQAKEKNAAQTNDSDDVDEIPPSPTSSTATDTSTTRSTSRVNRSLRFNNTQSTSLQQQSYSATKSTQSIRKNVPSDSPRKYVQKIQATETSSSRNTRKRPMSPKTKSNLNEGDTASPIRKQSKLSVNSSEIPRTVTSNKISETIASKINNSASVTNTTKIQSEQTINRTSETITTNNQSQVTSNKASETLTAQIQSQTRSKKTSKTNASTVPTQQQSNKPTETVTTKTQTQTTTSNKSPEATIIAKEHSPITNKLRAKNSNVPEKSQPKQKTARSTQSKQVNSPSSKENEPKGRSTPIANSSSSGSDSEPTDSDEPVASTPKTKQKMNISLSKSKERMIKNSRNPVISLPRTNLSNLTITPSRMSTRNSTRKDRQNNMIMTRTRLSMEFLKAPKSMAKSKTTNQKVVASSKFSKIPVNIALHSNKTNINSAKAKPQPAKSVQSSQSSQASSDSSESSSEDDAPRRKPETPTSKSKQKPQPQPAHSESQQRTTKPALASRIARSTRNLNAQTLLRKRKM